MKNKILVIGGGASGMVAAITAAACGGDVTIYEKNERIGKKLLATGNGKCNLTNMDMSADMYHSENPSFVKNTLAKFGRDDTIGFFQSLGLVLKNKNGYIYPFSEQASSVLDVLRRGLDKNNVNIVCDCGVDAVIKNKTGFTVKCKDREEYFDKVILACGSSASLSKRERNIYGKNGLELTRQLGIKNTEIYPSLVQVVCREGYFVSVSGVRCDCSITLYENDNALCRERGELQLTDYGISGIPVFQMSGLIARGLKHGNDMRCVIDLLPDYEDEAYEEFMRNRILDFKGDTLENFMLGILNKKLNIMFIKQAGLKPTDRVEDSIIEKLIEILCTLRQWVVTCSDTMGFDKAQVCAGGVCLDELDSDFESLDNPGLFVVGELTDADGKCGGYNLQWAFSSGYLAGKAAAGACSE